MAPSVQCRKVWLTPNTRVPCSNAAKTRNPLKFAGVPQTTGPISVASRPKFTILWGHMGEILVLNKFFPIVDTCLNCEDRPIDRQSCGMVPRWRLFGEFLPAVFSASRAQHVSDVHSKTPFTRYNRLSNRLSNGFDNRLTTVLNEQSLFVQPVVNPVVQPV